MAQATTLRAAKQRLALYDPMTGERVNWEGPVFIKGTDGERQARETVAEFNRLTGNDPEVTLCLGAFDWK